MLSKRSGFAAAVPADGNIYVFGGEGLPDPQTGGEQLLRVLKNMILESINGRMRKSIPTSTNRI